MQAVAMLPFNTLHCGLSKGQETERSVESRTVVVRLAEISHYDVVSWLSAYGK